jgi:hypothetical protein
MLKELVEYIFDRGVQEGEHNTEHVLSAHPNDPDKRLVTSPTGITVLDMPRPTPAGADVCHSVADFGRRLIADLDTYEKTIWYDEKSAVSYSTDEFRIRSVSVNFPAHPILASVLNLADTKWFDQKQVMRLLRISFAGLADDFVMTRFRTLNWESAKRAKQVISHGKSSLDAEVRSSVTTDEGELPEAFVITVPLFADSEYRTLTFPARIAVELDTDQSRIGLVLLPGVADEILSAQRRSVEGFLGSALDSDKYEFICGKSVIKS